MRTTHRRYVWILLLLCSLLVTYPGADALPAVRANNGNVLVNGDFEDSGFNWFYPNHFLAPGWYRWWINTPPATMIPEYDDGRRENRWPPYNGVHMQVYFKWGSNYHAGIYQVVENVTPCVPYEFSMYVNSRGNVGTEPHARVGLDPQGTQITLDHVHNDLIGGQMPPLTTWSSEQTALYVWDRVATTAEPLGTRLTAITFANPFYVGANTPWYDTWWDTGVLQQVPFPDGKLPEPASWDSPYINGVGHSFAGDTLNLSWNTTVPASTQVWYTLERVSAPVTPTATLTETVFLPLVHRSTNWQTTPLNPTPTTTHNVSIAGVATLQSGDKVIVRLLSRRPGPDACVTEGWGAEFIKP
ncbi:MAG: hypothetical protein JW892_17900 [Anaerolineae bacterium]|nr:hypothetical protein [Anaerolineae bacterium]